jgi:hypothetical protein
MRAWRRVRQGVTLARRSWLSRVVQPALWSGASKRVVSANAPSTATITASPASTPASTPGAGPRVAIHQPIAPCHQHATPTAAAQATAGASRPSITSGNSGHISTQDVGGRVRLYVLARLRKKSTEAEPKACFDHEVVKGY